MSSERIVSVLGVDVDLLCEAILADARVLKAVRGGLSEHLGYRMLRDLPTVSSVRRSERGGTWEVELVDGTDVTVSVHSADSSRYADGTAKVDLRRSAPVDGQRLYRVGDCHVLVVSLVAVTGQWEWRFAQTAQLDTRTVDGQVFLEPNCRIDSRWGTSLDAALAGTGQPAAQLDLFAQSS